MTICEKRSLLRERREMPPVKRSAMQDQKRFGTDRTSFMFVLPENGIFDAEGTAFLCGRFRCREMIAFLQQTLYNGR